MNIIDFLQFGGIGIAGLTLWILYKVITNHFHDSNEIMRENTKATVENTKITSKLAILIDVLIKRFKD